MSAATGMTAVGWLGAGYRALAPLALAGAGLLVGVGCWHALVRARYLPSVRAGAASVSRGDPVTVRIDAHPRRSGRHPLRARLTGLGTDNPVVLDPRAGITVQAVAARRGRLTPRLTDVVLADPFDLFRRHVADPVDGPSVTVVPRRAAFPLRPGAAEQLGDGTERPSDQDGTFASFRTYRPGDDVRLIHWAASARTTDGAVLVRQNVRAARPAVTVVLDSEGGGTPFETAVDVAYSVLRDAAAAGSAVTLLIGARRHVGVRAATDALVTVTPKAGRSTSLPRTVAGGLVVVVTAGSVPMVPGGILVRIGSGAPFGVVRAGGGRTLTAATLAEASRLWTAALR